MSESAIDTDPSGPSLEQILWRTVDRWTEAPALVDADEFAAHISDAFDGEVPAEAFIARFFGENPGAVPSDMAEAIVQATRDRLHVYEFDLNQLEYVVLEEKDKFVVVSDFGQFALENDDLVSRAIESAVLPARSAATSETSLDRSGKEPRAFFVRESGEVVAVDVQKIAKALDEQMLKQVSMPVVDQPMSRMAPFAPVRKRMTSSREERALRQDLRTLLPPPKLLAASRDASGLDESAIANAPPSGAESTIFVLLPDGSLARPAMGSATRWQAMVSDWAVRASMLTLGGSSRPAIASSQQRFAMQSGKVIALFSGGAGANDTRPGMAGDRAALQGGGISAARADGAPIRILGDDELARAVLSGATLLPGFTAQLGSPQNAGYWIQPEAYFAPADSDRALVAGDSQGRGGLRQLEGDQGSGGSGQAMELAQGGAQPLQLGEITGDPWSDWALTGGGDATASMMLAARGRSKSAMLAALGRGTGSQAQLQAVPGLAAFSSLRGGELRVNGQPVVAFRAPDGSVVVQRQHSSIRLAALSRADSSELGAGRERVQIFRSGGSRRPDGGLAELTGAIPSTALASLQLALERTANLGGYKLPLIHFESSADAIDLGQSLDLDLDDPRRFSARLAGPISLSSGADGQVAQMVLSMPFPNQGEVHVGSDLSDALQAYLGAPVLPSGNSPGVSASLAGAGIGSAAGFFAFNDIRGDSHGVQAGQGSLDFSGLHGAAVRGAQDALLALQDPSLAPLLVRSSSVSGLPDLLARALAASGAWAPGPGAPMPGGIRDFALQGPFDLPELGELVEGAQPGPAAAMLRPLGVGEEEIVIPMPLWAQMGRGRISATSAIMASPFSPPDHAPPLGAYQLVRPFPGPVDFTNGAPGGTPGIVSLHGPANLELVAGSGAGVSAHSRGGRAVLGQVAVDDGDSAVSSRGRMRIGAPLDPAAIRSRLEAARQAKVAQAAAENGTPGLLSQGLDAGKSALLGEVPSPFIDGSLSTAGSGAASQRPMASALQSSLRMSDDVSGRLGQSEAGTFSGAPGAAGSLGGSGMSDLTLVASQPTEGAAPSGPDLAGLAPGAWSGDYRGADGYATWTYGPGSLGNRARSFGGVDLSGMSRPLYPSLPTALRFRYAGAPLWWAGSLRGGSRPGEGAEGFDDPATNRNRALQSGVRAANSAASIWRSILVSSAPGSSEAGAAAEESGAGAMDRSWDASADQLGRLGTRMDALAGTALVSGSAGAGALSGRGAESIYVAMSSSGRAGAVTAQDLTKPRASSIEMSIVAGIPPSPPPLESMGSGRSDDYAQPHARGKKAVAEQKESSEAVSHSKIEGSVDAVAQRIYHRIRRRIESDRERFGG